MPATSCSATPSSRASPTAVNDNDDNFPPEFRLSKTNRGRRTSLPPLDGYTVVDLSSGIAGAYCTKLLADGGADGRSKSKRPRVIRCAAGRRRGAESHAGDDGALFSFLAGSKHSVVVDPGDADDLDLLRRAAGAGGRGGVVARIAIAERSTSSRPRHSPTRTRT